MGSGFYDIKQVMKRLGKSERTIYTYVKTGFLTPMKDEGKNVFAIEEVEALAIELGVNFPTMSRKVFHQLIARISKLEGEMAVVRRAYGLPDFLRPAPEIAQGLHLQAERAFAARDWTEEEISMWADLFPRMDEVTFDMMTEALNKPQPWVVFYNLCLALRRYVSTDRKYDSSLALQNLNLRLGDGYKQIRSVILLRIETCREGATDVLDALSGAESTLLRRLAPVSKLG